MVPNAASITPAPTGIAAFVGFFSRGPLNQARRILGAADVARVYGGLRADSLASYALHQFFVNGGQEAWVVRTAAGAPACASVEMRDQAGIGAFRAVASSEGRWGNHLRLDIDYGTSDPDSTFNLTISQIDDGQVVSSEAFLDLSTTPDDPRDAVDVVSAGSTLIRLERAGTPATTASRPAPTGTVSRTITNVAELTLDGQLTVTIGASSGGPVGLGSVPDGIDSLADALQVAIRRADPVTFAKATVTVAGTPEPGAFLHVKSGTNDPADVVELSGDLADALGLAGVRSQNVQQFVLGSASSAGKQAHGVSGDDGALPGAEELIAAVSAFDAVDLINLLCLPDTDRLTDRAAAAVATSVARYAAKRRAFYLLDPPNVDVVRADVPGIKAWIETYGALRHENAAVFFPRPLIRDPLDGHGLRSVPPSGTIAGLYARLDRERGVWKAPAGLHAALHGVQELEHRLTDAENGVLNPIAVNALRTFRDRGHVCWGARTLAGADGLASEWKYVPVRRLALFLEESLYRGTAFAVLESNDEPLWSVIRLSVAAFMQSLLQQGAFQGRTPREAYFVKCDRETTTAEDVSRGLVNIVVGFAPMKPAEFVVLEIHQRAGQPPD